MTATATPKYVGQSVLRREDAALTTGRGTFVDDIAAPGALHLAVLRSPLAHARIRGVGLTAARAHPGVVAAFSGAELAGEFAIGLPCGWPVTEDIRVPHHPPLAVDEVNHVGDGGAVVLATDAGTAQDALELVEVDYEELPAVFDVEAALAEGAPLVHEDLGTNHCYTWPLATGDVDAAFAEADVVVEGRYLQQRVIASPMEPRAVLVTPDPVGGGFTIYSSTQVPHFLRVIGAMVVGMPDSKLRVIAPDVGGGFGAKLNVYAEEALALVLARRLARPVKWTETRSEHHVATTHGRGQVQRMAVAATRDGKILGMKVELLADMGAYLQLLTPGIAVFGAFTYCGLYDFGAYSFECRGVFTNLTPTDAYRGAGRSEAAYAHERIMDDLARELGMDAAELRLRNLHPKFDEPRTVPSGVLYDSGDYEPCMREAMRLVDYDAVRAEQRARRESGDPVLYDHRLTPDGRATFLDTTWSLTPVADRIGFRYSGATLETVDREPPFGAGQDPSNIVDAPYPIGSIQVPGSVEPIVLHRDAVSGGGYMMVATVLSGDLDVVAQSAPGTRTRFVEVDLDGALAARADRRRRLDRLRDALA